MAAIVVSPQENPLSRAIMEIFAQSDAREAERRRLAQQASQFQQTYDLDAQQTAAQVAAANASAGASGALAGKTKYEIAEQIIAPIRRDFDAITTKAGPEQAAMYVAGRLKEYENNPEVLELLKAHATPRPRLASDDMNESLATYGRDVAGRVAAGGQNAIDVNLATKLLTNEQLSPAAFGNQDTREFGIAPLRESVAIADDRSAGATPKLQSSTQIQVGREGNASAERIAAMRVAADRDAALLAANAKLGGTGGGRAERNANLAADGVALIDDLLRHEGFSGAVGAKDMSSLFGFKDEPIGGTDAAGFASKLERLRSLTTLPNLEMMRGLGAMSEKEMELVRASAGALSRNINEVEFKRELQRMRPVLEKAATAINFGAQIGVPEAQGQVFEAPDGKKYRKVPGGWVEVE